MSKRLVAIALIVLFGLSLVVGQAAAYRGPQPQTGNEATATLAPVDDSKPGKGPKDKEKGKPEKIDQDEQGGKKTNFKGTVGSYENNVLTITLKDGSSASVQITDSTRIKTKKGQPATFEPGARVMAKAVQNADGSYTAVQVHLFPSKPGKVHRVGQVTDYQPGASITFQDKKGGSSTFAITADTKILPEDQAGTLAVGSTVTIISPNSQNGETLTAKGIVIHTPDDGE